MEALIESKADLIFFQEHNVRKKHVRRLKKDLKQTGSMVHFGPANEGGMLSSAMPATKGW